MEEINEKNSESVIRIILQRRNNRYGTLRGQTPHCGVRPHKEVHIIEKAGKLSAYLIK